MTNNYTKSPLSKEKRNLKPSKGVLKSILNYSKTIQSIKTKNQVFLIHLN